MMKDQGRITSRPDLTRLKLRFIPNQWEWDYIGFLKFQVQNFLKRGKEDLTTVVTVSVIVYYTQEFEAITPDVKGHVEHLIENINIIFLKSGILLKLSIHCILRTNLGEAPGSADRIREFKKSQGKSFECFQPPSCNYLFQNCKVHILFLQAVRTIYCNQLIWQCF